MDRKEDSVEAHHYSDSLAVTDKVHGRFPPLPFHDLCSRARVVHGVSRDNVLAIRGPAQPQHMGCATTLEIITSH